MFGMHYSERHDVGHFNYYLPRNTFPMVSLGYLNIGSMKTLHLWDVDIPTYQFRINKNFGISSSREMFRVHPNQKNYLGTFNYFVSLNVLPNGLLSDPNGDSMQKL